MTRAQAVTKARIEMRALIQFAVGFGSFPATKAQAVGHRIDTTQPHVKKTLCNGKEAWLVTWPYSSPIAVGSGVGPQLAKWCS
jgi:hypothetical protein